MTKKLLDECGYSQKSLAQELNLRGVKCTQPTIGRILKDTDPSYTVGNAIREIYLEVAIGRVA